ncbi:MAG: adenosylcobinamide-GDP ribazoletransferase [Chloroflexi bacterium]|nr:adenosylcobinamide-GDP ribazoletransferase [Chloroflexota bacterium]
MGFYTAVTFLTIFPLPKWMNRPSPHTLGSNPSGKDSTLPSTDEPAFAEANVFARSVPYFPVVGLLLGLVLVLLDLLLRLAFPPLVVSALLVGAALLLTGGLHLEGFIDSCDGLLAAKSPEERLAIMKDSRAGAFGVAGAGALLLVRFAALASLTGDVRLVALLLAPALSRWAMAYAMAAFPYGRHTAGLGKIFKDYLEPRHAIYATVVALLIAGAVWQLNGLATWGIACVTTWLAAKFTLSRIPGLTGDVYGAVNEVAEVAVFLFAPLLLSLASRSV